MEITLNKTVIKQMVRGFTKVKPRHPSIPILKHVMFQVKAKTLTALATNLEDELIFSTSEIVREMCSEDPFLVPLAELKDLAKGKGNELVKIELEEDAKLRITTLVAGLPVARTVDSLASAEFPQSMSVTIDTKPYDVSEMVSLFQRAALSVDQKHDRWIIQGVHLSCHNKAVVGTDGRRIGVFYPSTLPLDASVTLPVTRVLSGDLLQAGDGEIGWSKDANGVVDVVVFATERWRYSVRQMGGTYPNWQQIVPERGDKATIKFTPASVEAVEQAVQALPDQDEDNHGVTVFANDEMVVLVSQDDDGFSHAVIPEATFSGSCTVFKVNRHFFVDAFNSGFNTVYISRSEHRPLRFEGDAPGMYVLMPIDMGARSKALTQYFRELPLNTTTTERTPMDDSTSKLYNARGDALKAWTNAKLVRNKMIEGKPVDDAEFATLTKALEKTEDAYYNHLKCSKPTATATTPNTKEIPMAKKPSKKERAAAKKAEALAAQEKADAAEANAKVDAAEAKHAKAQAKIAAKAEKKAAKEGKGEPEKADKPKKPKKAKRLTRMQAFADALMEETEQDVPALLERADELYVAAGGKANPKEAKWSMAHAFPLLVRLKLIEVDGDKVKWLNGVHE